MQQRYVSTGACTWSPSICCALHLQRLNTAESTRSSNIKLWPQQAKRRHELRPGVRVLQRLVNERRALRQDSPICGLRRRASAALERSDAGTDARFDAHGDALKNNSSTCSHELQHVFT